MRITNKYLGRVLNKNNRNLSFGSYKGAVEEWEKSKPLFKEALEKLDDKKISLVVQGGSFPSLQTEDFGIGSPYSNGASSLKNFLDGLVDSVVLGPWGKTIQGSADYAMHSPYLSTLESLNPFFIDFKSLTTKKQDQLLSKETFNTVVKNYKTAKNYKNDVQIDYIYASNAVNIMLDEIYKTHLKKLDNSEKRAIIRQKEFELFKKNNEGVVLDKIFDILFEKNQGRSFSEWNELDKTLPVLLDKKDKKAQARFKQLYKENKYEIDKYVFTQFIAQRQAQDIKSNYFKYIGDKQVAIYGADEWKLQDIILDEIEGKKITLGVPPDSFSNVGRNWNMAVLDYTKLFDKEGNLLPAGEKVKRIYANAFSKNKGGLRIDHFIGIIDPFVCVNGSADITKGAGRLYSSPNNPVLKNYAYKGSEEEIKRQYCQFFEKIILAAAYENGLSEKNIFPEDVGSITPIVQYVIDKYNLASMKITQFANPLDKGHKYHPANAQKKDIITLGTHDTPPQITYIASMDREQYPKRVELLAQETNQNKDIFYKPNAQGKKNALLAEFACLFTSGADNVHIFFPSFFGIDDYYNKPGDKTQTRWRVRIPNDYKKLYFKNLNNSTAFNPYLAFSLALSKKEGNEILIEKLKQQQDNILREIDDMIKNESPVSSYNPLEQGIASLEERNKLFLQDANYRNNLAKHLNVKPEALKAIVGQEELRAILNNASYNNFVSINKDGSYNPSYRINLHIHTNNSDGLVSTKEILDKAQKYALKSQKPFLFAISDHDSLEGVKEAIEIIAQNPEKYDRILFVPSVEMNTKYINKPLTKEDIRPYHAFQLETLIYSINPYDSSFNSFFNDIKQANKEYITRIIDYFKAQGLDVSYHEASNIIKNEEGTKTHIAYSGSPGLMDDLINYIKTKIELIDNEDKKQELYSKLDNIINEHKKLYGNIHLMPKTPTMDEVIKAANRINAISAIAHPAKINLSGTYAKGDVTIKAIIDDFIKSGGDFIEYNYQYGNADDSSMNNWINLINDYYALKYPNLSGTGGIDNHGKNIFRR